jgi:hypothetical protein
MKAKEVSDTKVGSHKSDLVVKSNIKSGPPIKVVPL